MIELFQCPHTQTSLSLLADDQFERLNNLIEGGLIRNHAGQTVAELPDSALINETGTWIYAVRNGITGLMKDKAISARLIENNDD